MAQQYIYGDKYFKQRLDNFKLEDILNLEAKRKTIINYIKALESGRIEKTKEESIQADFLNNFFGDVLGYEYKDSQKWNLEKEHKSKTDTTKSDGALGFFKISEHGIRADVRAVIELKDALTDLDKPQHRLNDKRTPVEQAFSYSSKAGGKCKWVIVSNFKEIRIYHSSDQGAYEKFNVHELIQDENLKRFFYILQKEQLISESSESTIEKLYRERQEIEQTISKKFYNEYKTLRLDLFTHLKTNNKGKDEFLLFNKTQKLLDRFIFVCFCEDAGLLPPYTLKKTKEILKNAFDFEENKLWRQLKGLFHSIDKGNPPHDINRFNGGLFAKDEDLDNLIILDVVLLKLIDFSEYDFDSDINVNILGHIFEQSLTDIEEIKTQIGNGKHLTHEEKSEVKKNGKRKKEGIFYTPEYITRYIVKEAVGGWLEDRKKELGFYDLPELTSEDFQSIKPVKKKVSAITYNKTIEKYITFWEIYKEKLRNIKVLDPACGSGAFLNQVFDFLYREGQKVNDQLSALRLGQREIFELDKHILTNNIFGVDLNPESVEITKLSLWLKTANKGRELTALDENIRCGNSLIDDEKIAYDKAFNWSANFKNIISNGGFDIIIGNPPYIPTESISEIEKTYFSNNYKSAFGRINIFPLFYEKAINLINQQGIIGFITPYTILKNQYFIEARKIILNSTWIRQIVDFQNKKVFEDAVVDSVILILKKDKPTNTEVVLIENINNFEHQDYSVKVFDQQIIHSHEDLSFINGQSNDLFEKIFLNSKKVSEVINFNQGIITGDNKKFIAKTKTELSKPLITGSDFNRYSFSFSGNYIEYSDALHRTRTKGIFEVVEKILLRQTGSYPICTIDTESYYTLDTVHNGLIKDKNFNSKYLLCLLNSKLIRYIYEKQINEVGKVFAQVKIIYINELPIKIIDLEGQKSFIEKAEIMLAKSKELDDLRIKFLNFIKSKYKIESPSNKLQNWIELEFSTFMAELTKNKNKISTADEYEFMQVFEKEIKRANNLQEILTNTDNEIDKMVFNLYGINEVEQQTIINK